MLAVWGVIVAVALGIIANLVYDWIKNPAAISTRLEKALGWLRKSRLEARPSQLRLGVSQQEDIIRKLIHFLQEDQFASGQHQGQFGRTARGEREMIYQLASGPERLEIKPRLYLTGWPVFVLSKHSNRKECLKMLSAAQTGILRLLDGYWVRVGMGATKYTSPIRSSSEISYRHSIRAAQILLAIEAASLHPREVLGKMLDDSQGMQTESGGWRQCDSEHTDEDLWASAYAAGFLSSCIEEATALELTPNTRNQATNALTRTLAWLQVRWDVDKWKYGEASTEDNAPILFHEFELAAIKYRPEMIGEICAHFDTFLDSMNHPKSSYIANLKDAETFSASVRLAYAYHMVSGIVALADEKSIALRAYALNHMGGYFTSVDAAMLIDMLLSNRVQRESLPTVKKLTPH